jgi:hypothetical protein
MQASSLSRSKCFAAHAMWHECVSGSRPLMDFVKAHTTAGVKFRPPTYYATWTGQGPFFVLMSCVTEVFEDFVYHRELLSQDGRQWFLEFTATVDGKRLKGVDLMQLNADGRIEVMVRVRVCMFACGMDRMLCYICECLCMCVR